MVSPEDGEDNQSVVEVFSMSNGIIASERNSGKRSLAVLVERPAANGSSSRIVNAQVTGPSQSGEPAAKRQVVQVADANLINAIEAQANPNEQVPVGNDGIQVPLPPRRRSVALAAHEVPVVPAAVDVPVAIRLQNDELEQDGTEIGSEQGEIEQRDAEIDQELAVIEREDAPVAVAADDENPVVIYERLSFECDIRKFKAQGKTFSRYFMNCCYNETIDDRVFAYRVDSVKVDNYCDIDNCSNIKHCDEVFGRLQS